MDRLPDQIQPAQLTDAVLGLFELIRAEDVSKEVAGLDQAEQHHVARIGDLVSQQDLTQPRPHFLLLAVVDDRILPSRRDPQEAAILIPQNPTLHEPLQGLLPIALRSYGNPV